MKNRNTKLSFVNKRYEEVHSLTALLNVLDTGIKYCTDPVQEMAFTVLLFKKDIGPAFLINRHEKRAN